MRRPPAGAAARGSGALAGAPADHVTPYDRFAWSERAIERWLASGRHAAELGAYFGVQEYRQLAALARRAARVRASPRAPRVILVPGIMGSQLGLRRPAPLPPDVLWIDPLDIERGRLSVLRLPDSAPVVPLGVVLFSYLRLKLRLRAHGIAVECHDYDWRRPVVELGRELAARLRTTDAARLAIVGHSMGGLAGAHRPGPALDPARRARGVAGHAQSRLLRRRTGTSRHVCGGAQDRTPGRQRFGRIADDAGVQLLSESLRPAPRRRRHAHRPLRSAALATRRAAPARRAARRRACHARAAGARG